MPNYRLITNLTFKSKGPHNSSLAYSIRDIVTSAGGSRVYFALQDVPVGISIADKNYWILMIDLLSAGGQGG